MNALQKLQASWNSAVEKLPDDEKAGLIAELESCRNVSPPSYEDFGNKLKEHDKFWNENHRDK